MAPKITSIVGAGGFWTSASRRAYTVVGSFIRYLIDEYGIEKFKRAYSRGDFRGAYGASVPSLVEQWRAFLDELQLSDRTMEVARFLYRQPSIFGKVCPRTTAEIRRRASAAAARGDVGTMRELYDELLGHAPKHVGYRLEYARRLVDVRDLEGAEEISDRLLDRQLAPIQRAKVRHLRGDVAWHRDRIETAAQRYQRCLEQGLPVDRDRLIRAKHLSLQPSRAPVRELAYEYFLGDASSSVSLFFPVEWARRRPRDPLAAYLVGRRLWQDRQWDRANSYLRRAVENLPAGTLRGEARRIHGRALYFAGQLSRASEVFAPLRKHGRPRYRLAGREWLERIEWRRQRD